MSDFSLHAVSYRDKDAGQQFANSLHETGFAILTDHPITAERIQEMYRVWAGYFGDGSRYSDAVKPGEAHGYYPFKSENAKDSSQKDLKEFFHVYGSLPIPSLVEGATRAFQYQMILLGVELLSWLDACMPEEIKSRLSEGLTEMIAGSEQNLLRILHYPPLAETIEPGEVRAAAHEDINLITLLVAGSEPGLQAKDKLGNWHDVPCDASYITVNSGDMLAKATGDYFPSTSHRVVNPEGMENRSRYSMPLFMHPRPEVRLDKYQTAGGFLEERLREIGLK